MLEGCQYDNPGKTFLHAKQFLEEKYGDPLKICTAAMNRVRRFVAIPTRRNQLSTLEHFATALRALIYMTESMMYINYTDFIKELVQTTFPLFMKREWSCIAEKILLKEKRILTLADLLEFIGCCINCLDNRW